MRSSVTLHPERFPSMLHCYVIKNLALFCLRINLILVCAAVFSRPRSSVWDCFVWKVREISRDSPAEENNNLVLLWAFHVRSRFSWTHTHTIKQPVTSTLTVSPCSTGRPRFRLFSVFGSSDKSWHGSALLGAFRAPKTLDVNRNMT